MVTIKSRTYFTLGLEAEIGKIESTISETLRENNLPEDKFLSWYAQNAVMIVDMKFEWGDNVPEQYVALENWWKMIENGKSIIDCYMFYRDNLASSISSQITEAVLGNMEIWKPEDQKLMEESTDPN